MLGWGSCKGLLSPVKLEFHIVYIHVVGWCVLGLLWCFEMVAGGGHD